MDMQSKSCIITGATSGIGKMTAIELASIGMRVIICGRNSQKCAETCREITFKTGNSKIEYNVFDLASLHSIRSFVEKITEKYKKIDFLINNAGVWEKERKLSFDGIEMTFAVNHLGPLFLTILLKDILAASSSSSVINISSSSYQKGKIDFSDIEMKNSYNGFNAYSNSKLINLLVMKYLASLLNETGITVNNIHPGIVFTGIYKDFNPIMRALFRLFMISPSAGAKPIISFVLSGNAKEITGRYYDRFNEKDVLSADNERIIGEKLWNTSVEYLRNFDDKINFLFPVLTTKI